MPQTGSRRHITSRQYSTIPDRNPKLCISKEIGLVNSEHLVVSEMNSLLPSVACGWWAIYIWTAVPWSVLKPDGH